MKEIPILSSSRVLVCQITHDSQLCLLESKEGVSLVAFVKLDNILIRSG